MAGATRGAGRAIAIELARAGAIVHATGRSSRVAGPSEIGPRRPPPVCVGDPVVDGRPLQRMPEPHKAAGNLDQPGRLRGLLRRISVDARFGCRPSHQTHVWYAFRSREHRERHDPGPRVAAALGWGAD